MVKKMKVDILGTEYTVTESTAAEDKFLIDKVLRHEIIHAFLFESGLQENYHNEKWGHDEIMIDWFAIQFPKIQKAFYEADCLV